MAKCKTCPKCKRTSGGDWSQCGDNCPMPVSPHYKKAIKKTKKVRVTVELNSDFLKLLQAEIQLSDMRKKNIENRSTPSMMLALSVFSEACGGFEDQVDSIIPTSRKEELKMIHNERKVIGD